MIVSKRRRRNQGGFALLMIFLMASAVALMLYMQLPRQAFESERDKEQMLIDRGEQYKRAIYLYYVSNNHQWPSKIDDLENTNSHRYLRQRYIDPYTGKDEWRLIHTNGAYLTDSLVTPPPAQGTPGVQGGALAGTGGATTQGFTLTQSSAQSANGTNAPTDPNAPPQQNAQVQRRASDNTMVSNSSYQNLPGNAPGSSNNSNNGNSNDPGYQPFNPATLPPISLYPNGYNTPPVNGTGGTQPPTGNQAGVNQGGVNQGGVNQAGVNQAGVNQSSLNGNLGQTGTNPGITQVGANPINLPGTNFQMTNPGLPAPNPSTGGFGGSGFGSPTGQLTPVSTQNQGFQNQGGQNQSVNQNFGAPGPNGTPTVPNVSSQAAGLMQQLLTQPRQAPVGVGPNQQPTTGGGGLAGVASTYKGVTIKSYADRTKYQEWEFVFQINQQGSGIQTQTGQGPNGSGGIPTAPGANGTGAAGTTGFGGTGFGSPGAPGVNGTPGANGATGAAGANSSPFFSTTP